MNDVAWWMPAALTRVIFSSIALRRARVPFPAAVTLAGMVVLALVDTLWLW
ncbi:hypothetical protein [Actinoplanes sp. G11-F43]|uniref:hypothetical protein n=1 Tax=Actinoplanes sp. G11-F43 TaxID=3424130 RepID=UPI003D334BCE